MRIYIIGNDGITLCREAPAMVNEGEIAVASNEELHAAPLSDHGQRAIVLALIFEPVLANEDGMGVSAPVPDQSRAGLQHDTGIAWSAGFPRACGLQTAPQRPARPAMGALLQLMSEGSDQQIATKA